MLTTVKIFHAHVLNNKFIIIFNADKKLTPVLKEEIIESKEKNIDQLIFVYEKSCDEIDVSIFNRDGSTAGLCGNAFCCIGWIITQILYKEKGLCTIKIYVNQRLFTVSPYDIQEKKMILNILDVPADELIMNPTNPTKEKIDNIFLKPEYKSIVQKGFFISIGNPHFIFFVKKIEDFSLGFLGHFIENHPIFPDKVNVEIIETDSNQSAKIRIWERGTGETSACGSGACACAIALFYKRDMKGLIQITMPGGTVETYFDRQKNTVHLIAPVHIEGEAKIEI